jgi:hypothetical protein
MGRGGKTNTWHTHTFPSVLLQDVLQHPAELVPRDALQLELLLLRWCWWRRVHGSSSRSL